MCTLKNLTRVYEMLMKMIIVCAKALARKDVLKGA